MSVIDAKHFGADRLEGRQSVLVQTSSTNMDDESRSGSGSQAESQSQRKEAKGGMREQHTWKAVKKYRLTLLWASFVGLSALMWGYDALIGVGLLSSPQFRQDFGYEYKGEWVLQAKWQIAFNTASSIGGFVGCILMGDISDRFGRRIALGGSCILSCGAIFAQAFTNHNGVLLLGKLLNGVSLGAYLTISSSYAAEACPLELRGISTSGVNLFMGIGQLIANGILKACGNDSTSRAYRLPFALQWIPAIVILIFLPFCPESPVWLARQNRVEDAAQSLTKLGYPDVQSALSQIVKTTRQEQDASGKKPSYLECFRGTDRRRTEIAMGSFAVTQVTGVVFIIGYSTYFFELAGLSNSNAFSLGLGVSGLGIIGNIFSWFLINSVGRRPSFLNGTCGLLALLLLVGILDVIPGGDARVWVQSVCIIFFNCIYFLAVGPMAWALYAEVGSDRLRSRTVGLGLVVQNVFGVILPTVIPYLLNPDEANLKGKIAFIFAFLTALSIVWIWFRVPETKGRVVEELDEMFAAKVPTRKFKEYKVHA